MKPVWTLAASRPSVLCNSPVVLTYSAPYVNHISTLDSLRVLCCDRVQVEISSCVKKKGHVVIPLLYHAHTVHDLHKVLLRMFLYT